MNIVHRISVRSSLLYGKTTFENTMDLKKKAETERMSLPLGEPVTE